MASTPGTPVERRPNTAASSRAIRLTLLYLLGVLAVYGILALLANAAPSAGSAGTGTELVGFALIAVILGAAGTLYSLGAAPRAVEIGTEETVVIGRFGRRYRFPRVGGLQVTVLRRFPPGFLNAVVVESVEISGGTSRRSFLLDEDLLRPDGRPSGSTGPA